MKHNPFTSLKLPPTLIEQRGLYTVWERERRQWHRPGGNKSINWTEYQVKYGRKVISRHDSLKGAREDADMRTESRK